ncbi:MAG: hypothetical protein HYS66_10350 [Deltaproteobacteria bacterium]|nr:hypothetical protein [Deltaproteobacteria bacterium]
MSYSGRAGQDGPALSEGEFDREFEQHFQGELGELASYLDAVRQTLQVMSHAANGSYELIPAAADSVAEIHQETENGFDSIWQVVEEMQADQTMARELYRGGQSRRQPQHRETL